MTDNRATQPQPSGLLRGVALTGFATVLNIVALFGETVIAARMLPPAGFGSYALMVAVAGFLAMTVDLGLKAGVTRFIVESDADRRAALVSSSLGTRLAAIVLVGGLLFAGRDSLAFIDPALPPLTGWIALMFAVYSLDELLFGLLRGFNAYRFIALTSVVRSLLRVGLSWLLLAVFLHDVRALALSWAVAYGVSICLAYLVLPVRRRFAYNRMLVGTLIGFSLPLYVNILLWYAANQASVLLLGFFGGATLVAGYAVASRIPVAMQRLVDSFITVYYPAVTGLLAAEQHEQASRMLNESLRLLSFAVAFCALGAVVFGAPIIVLLFSATYADIAPIFGLLMLVLHLASIATTMGYSLVAAGFPRRSLLHDACLALLVVSFNLLLIPTAGIAGPALAALAAYIVLQPLLIRQVRRSGLQLLARPYLVQIGILWLCCGLFWIIQPTELLARAAFVVAFVGLNLLVGTVNWADLRRIAPDRLAARVVGRFMHAR